VSKLLKVLIKLSEIRGVIFRQNPTLIPTDNPFRIKDLERF